MSHKTAIRAWIFFAAVIVFSRQALPVQANSFSDELLPAVRRAAALIPGDPPSAIRVVSLNPFRAALSYMVEGASERNVSAAYPVFQIRFPRGWIVVDSALDREFVPKSTTFSDDEYNQIHVALRDAQLVVVTHEHHDHVAGVLRSPYLAQVRQHTLLTRAQVHSLIEHPNNPLIKIDSAVAAHYLTIDYDPFIPIAPGVVLIKAAGHTPGSQMVYVRLESGQEVILAGDVAWNMAGIETQRQKPEASTRDFGDEDRNSIARQLRWLRSIAGAQTAVVVSHDDAWISTLINRGVLVSGFDFKNP
jgi:glyoxylase-like metal-dependent hydrolase (beta-lactamase superfamily II)